MTDDRHPLTITVSGGVHRDWHECDCAVDLTTRNGDTLTIDHTVIGEGAYRIAEMAGDLIRPSGGPARDMRDKWPA